MTHNQDLLAQIQQMHATSKAQRAHLPPPQQRAMQALREAVEERRACLAELALRGRVDTPEYRKAEAQLQQWDAAWRSNR